jgi:Protein of unknown function (DUF1559)
MRKLALAITLGVVGIALSGCGKERPALQETEQPTTPKTEEAFVLDDTGQKVTAERKQSLNNLRRLGIAFHVYHDAMLAFPAGGTETSWRVTILPNLSGSNLPSYYPNYRLLRGQ